MEGKSFDTEENQEQPQQPQKAQENAEKRISNRETHKIGEREESKKEENKKKTRGAVPAS